MFDKFLEFLKEIGEFGIAFAGFSEGLFLPFPMETISIPLYLSQPQKAIIFAGILIFFSMIGSSIGYFIGKIFGEKVIKVDDKKGLETLRNLYSKNYFLTLLSSAITPIPFELYVFSAGIFKIKFRNFFILVGISRIIRHLPQSILIYFYGDKILDNLQVFVLGIGIFIFVGCIILKRLKNKKLK